MKSDIILRAGIVPRISQMEELFKETKWNEYDGSSERVAEFADMMAEAGAPEFLMKQCRRYTGEAVDTLASHHKEGVYQVMLDELIDSLVDRSK